MYQVGKPHKIHLYHLCKMTVRGFGLWSCRRIKAAGRGALGAELVQIGGASGRTGAGAVPVPVVIALVVPWARRRAWATAAGVAGAAGGRRGAGAGAQNCRCAFSGSAHFTPPCNFPGLLNSPLDFSGRILLPIKFSRALSYLGQNFSGARVCAHHAENSPFATYISHACENIFAVFARNSQISQ